MLSARNQLNGTVLSVRLGDVMAEVVVKAGEFELVSIITTASVKALNLKEGDEIKVVIKSTEVMIDKDV